MMMMMWVCDNVHLADKECAVFASHTVSVNAAIRSLVCVSVYDCIKFVQQHKLMEMFTILLNIRTNNTITHY